MSACSLTRAFAQASRRKCHFAGALARAPADGRNGRKSRRGLGRRGAWLRQMPDAVGQAAPTHKDVALFTAAVSHCCQLIRSCRSQLLPRREAPAQDGDHAPYISPSPVPPLEARFVDIGDKPRVAIAVVDGREAPAATAALCRHVVVRRPLLTPRNRSESTRYHADRRPICQLNNRPAADSHPPRHNCLAGRGVSHVTQAEPAELRFRADCVPARDEAGLPPRLGVARKQQHARVAGTGQRFDQCPRGFARRHGSRTSLRIHERDGALADVTLAQVEHLVASASGSP